ncbi:MAG: 3-phosphoshikimate 1-carboxyvinyltransferase [Clostridia bacterium]|nr:3-phosphoshikimate 1-carboxyvinyltransferase [Clostridia bacterium]
MDYSVRNIYGKTNNKPVEVEVPGSKSVTARAMLIAAVAQGESVLHGAQFSNDCLTFINCLHALGIECSVDGGTGDIHIKGCGGKLDRKEARVYVGNAGTAARFIPAFLAFQEGKYEVCCAEQMSKRPIKPLLDALQQIGAKITYLEGEGKYPFVIEGTRNPAPDVEVDIEESSQFLSGLLIASVCVPEALSVICKGVHGLEYVRMTVEMLRSFNADIVQSGNTYTVFGECHGRDYGIEPDMSAAAYFYAANKILGTSIRVKGADTAVLQGDSKFIKLLPGFNGGTIDMSGFSDQALTLAAIAPYLSKPTRITGVQHIRRQECDRIHAICDNLYFMGIQKEEYMDGVKIWPGQPRPAEIEPFGDHRVAMAFAITGLRADGITVHNAEVCSKTFKDYFTVLDDLCGKLTAK